MPKILSVIGTRPEAIKMAPVILELNRQRSEHHIRSIVCVTAQHREMLDQVLELFGIVPDYDLNLMKENQTPLQVAASVLEQLESILRDEQPDWVLVQGDTTTVMSTAIAAFYSHVKVGHIEAGLRTNNRWQPFPEEINRRVASVVSELHFAPTERARQNLLRELVADETIHVTGNSVIDALLWVADREFAPERFGEIHSKLRDIEKYTNSGGRVIVVTAHRRENFGAPLVNICQALLQIAKRYGDALRIVYPVHLNPNVKEPVYRWLGQQENIILVPPLDYEPMVHLMKKAYLILTDSGGIQEEAPSLGIPVLVLRNVTERQEAIDAGTVKLIGTDANTIIEETIFLLEDKKKYQEMKRAINPYGDGRAAERIVKVIAN